MNRNLKTLGRFALVSLVAFGGATVANKQHHENYWNGTIKRVQTVDFNMLSHILPAKLSLALMSGDQQEVQRTLDSNYGLFGLVVTDCETAEVQCNQSILYSSDSYLPWKDSLNLATLQASDFDVLRNPPPLYPEGYYEGPREPERQSTQLTNDGEIIGRVYYVRGEAPDFYQAYWKWIKGWPNSFLSDSGVSKYFALTTILFFLGGSATFLFIELLVRDHARKQELLKLEHDRKQEALESEKASLEQDAISLRKRIRDLDGQIQNGQSLIESLKTSLALSEQNTSNLSDKKLRLEQAIASLEKKFKEQPPSPDGSATSVASDLVKQVEDLTAQLQASLAQIEGLEAQIQTKENTAGNLRIVINSHREKKSEIEKQLIDAQARLSKLENLGSQLEELENLRRQLEETEALRANDAKEQMLLEAALKRAEEDNKNTQAKVDSLNERLHQQQPLPCNSFEKAVVKALKAFQSEHQGHWSVLDGIDVAPKGSNSMLTDCLVLGNSCVIAVEAKGYSGEIFSEKDLRNSNWLAKDDSGRRKLIVSAWGQNPYNQVRTYTEHALRKIKAPISRRQIKSHNDIIYFGVIVFPDRADLSKLDADLGKYYKVVHYSELGATLLEIEELVSRKGKSSKESFSFQDLERYLFGGADYQPASS